MSKVEIESLGHLVMCVSRAYASALSAQLKVVDVSVAQLAVYSGLADGVPKTQTILAQFAGVEQPSMAVTLMRMEKQGLVVRSPNPRDRRSATVHLSELALKKLDAIEEAKSRANDEMFRALTRNQRDTLKKALQKVVADVS